MFLTEGNSLGKTKLEVVDPRETLNTAVAQSAVPAPSARGFLCSTHCRWLLPFQQTPAAVAPRLFVLKVQRTIRPRLSFLRRLRPSETRSVRVPPLSLPSGRTQSCVCLPRYPAGAVPARSPRRAPGLAVTKAGICRPPPPPPLSCSPGRVPMVTGKEI